MINYMRGEIYRVLRKKSMYIYFSAVALAYFLLVFIQSVNISAEHMLSDAESLFTFLPAMIGGYLFAALYTDDLHAKNLSALIGFGLSKPKIILCKMILIALFGTVILSLAPLFMDAVYAVFGHPATVPILGSVYALALNALLLTFAFATLAGIVVYGLQRATFGIVVYILLSLGIISQVLTLLFSWEPVSSILPGLSDHLMSGITLRLLFDLVSGEAILGSVAEYIIYVGIAALLSALAFNKKELEF